MKKRITQENKNTTSRQFWFLSLSAIAAGICIGVCILLCYTPKAYKPDLMRNTDHPRLYLSHELAPRFFNQIQQNEPFELLISQPGLNEIINQLNWPQLIGDMSFSDPYIIISDQSILLMGTLTYEGVSSVLSITLFPTINADGTMNMNIQSVRLGMVPVKNLITKLAQMAFDDNQHYFEEDPKVGETIQAIINNEAFDPIFWFPEQWIRISDVSLGKGSLKLKLAPQEN